MEVNVGNRTSERKIDYWNKVVSKFRTSNLSVSEFSKKCDISPHQLSYWKTKLNNVGRSPVGNPFIEVKEKLSRTEEVSLSIGDLITINFTNPPSPSWISSLIESIKKVA